MRSLRNMEAFEADYKNFYKDDLSYLNFDVVVDEVRNSENDYELKSYESKDGIGKTFLFDEKTICVDAEDDEYEVIATYSGYGNH